MTRRALRGDFDIPPLQFVIDGLADELGASLTWPSEVSR
jgi:hypothetical protein